MTVLDELGLGMLTEADLAGLMFDGEPVPGRRRARRPSEAVMESVRGCVARGMSVAEAARSHGLDPAALRAEGPPTCFEVGLSRPLWGSEEELSDLLAEVAG